MQDFNCENESWYGGSVEGYPTLTSKVSRSEEEFDQIQEWLQKEYPGVEIVRIGNTFFARKRKDEKNIQEN